MRRADPVLAALVVEHDHADQVSLFVRLDRPSRQVEILANERIAHWSAALARIAIDVAAALRRTAQILLYPPRFGRVGVVDEPHRGIFRDTVTACPKRAFNDRAKAQIEISVVLGLDATWAQM